LQQLKPTRYLSLAVEADDDPDRDDEVVGTAIAGGCGMLSQQTHDDDDSPDGNDSNANDDSDSDNSPNGDDEGRATRAMTTQPRCVRFSLHPPL
jgi:hypothetical protein